MSTLTQIGMYLVLLFISAATLATMGFIARVFWELFMFGWGVL